MITQERLKEIICYDAETGVFTNRINRGNAKAGTIAGCISAKGYWCISIKDRMHRGHRLAWLYVYGEMPRGAIDHINGVRTDNRILNLRLATNAQNMQNLRASNRSKTGVKGVFRCSATGRYRAQIVVDGKLKFLGRFDTVEEGAAAYAEAARRFFGEFARTA